MAGERGRHVNDFKGRHFGGEIVLWAVRWYCRYAVSYRDLESMMTERGVAVDHSTIYRWVQRYAPEMEKRLRWQWRCPRSSSWRVDETYVKVRGKWAYLYRALDKFGNTIDFYLSATRNTKAAKRFLGKALRALDGQGTCPRCRARNMRAFFRIRVGRAGCEADFPLVCSHPTESVARTVIGVESLMARGNP